MNLDPELNQGFFYKKFNFFGQKPSFVSSNDTQAPGEAFSQTENTSSMKFLLFPPFFGENFGLHGSGSENPAHLSYALFLLLYEG